MTIKNRLAKLEEGRIGAPRVIVVECPEGVDYRPVLQASGVNAVDRDLVVIITDPVATEVGITVDGAARQPERAERWQGAGAVLVREGRLSSLS